MTYETIEDIMETTKDIHLLRDRASGLYLEKGVMFRKPYWSWVVDPRDASSRKSKQAAEKLALEYMTLYNFQQANGSFREIEVVHSITTTRMVRTRIVDKEPTVVAFFDSSFVPND